MSLLKQWRYLLLSIFAIVALTAFAACGDDDDDDGGDDGGEEPTDATGEGDVAPPEEQRLIMHSVEPEFLDPQRSNFEQDIAIQRMMFRGLYNLQGTEDGGAEVVPMYAEAEPEVSEDGTVFTVTIKEGMTWSDGEPIVAQHFVDGIIRGCDPNNASPYAYLLQSAEAGGIIGVVGCDELLGALGTEDAPLTPTEAELDALKAGIGATAIDDTTLEVTLLEPKLPNTFMQIFSLWVTFPARLDVVEQHGDAWTDPANIVNNGPYRLTEFVIQDHATLVANEAWGFEPAPVVQELEIRFIDDYAAAYRAYQTGELDQARIPDTEVPNAETEYPDELLVVGNARITALHIQNDHDFLGDVNVRKALARAIDRETFVEVTTTGVGVPATFWVVKGLTGHQEDKFDAEIGFDPEAAQQLLADAGFPDGQGAPPLRLTIADTPVRKAQAEFLKAQLEDILGITINIEVVDSRTRAQIFNEETFELFIGGWQLDYPDIENPIVGLFNTDGGNNHYNCSDPELDAKIVEGSQADNAEDHIRAFQEAEDLIIANVCTAPIYQEGIPYVVSPKIGGVMENPTLDAGMPGNWCVECWYVKAE
jgi:oligopeptide transport system substrate-binding protein